MVKYGGRWKSVAFALAAILIAFTMIEGAAGLYLFLEARYWPPIPSPQPPQNRTEHDEFLARLKVDQELDPGNTIVMQADDETGWSLQPTPADTFADVRVNRFGLRGGPIGSKKKDETRLLVVGDSSIFGVRCAEHQTIPIAAALDLKTRLGKPVVGLNGGVPGFDSGKSLNQLRRLFPLLKPDWVIIANLWSDCYNGQRYLDEGPGRKSRLVARTNTYRLLKRLLEPLLQSKKVGWFASEEEMRQADGKDARTSLDQYLINLVAMAEQVKERGARPLFLILPAPVDLTAGGAPQLVVEYREMIWRAARETGAPVVDGPALLAPRGVQLHHFLDEVHPGPELQQLLGRAVARAIADEMEK
jgi:lysophospholipase L1-like esterase